MASITDAGQYTYGGLLNNVWATNTCTATSTSAASVIQAYWSNAQLAYQYSVGNGPGATVAVAPKVAPAKPKASTNLAWLDQRVDEMRVRL